MVTNSAEPRQASNWFIEGTETSKEPVLAGCKCGNCGKISFPCRKVCPHCRTVGKMSVVRLSRIARLLGYAVVFRGSKYLEVPYTFGYVILPEGVKVYSLIVDCEPCDENLKIGMAMEVVSIYGRNAVNGEKNLFYAFRPARETT